MFGMGRRIAPLFAACFLLVAGCAAKAVEPAAVVPVVADPPVIVVPVENIVPVDAEPETASGEGDTVDLPEEPVGSAGAAVPESSPGKSSAPVARKSVELLKVYSVRGGESLWSIAARRDVYGDALLWPLVYQANRDQIMDPRQIFVGQQLTIPRGLSDKDLEDARQKARESKIFPLDLLLKK